MNKSALDLYPVRPGMQVGESLVGYLHRFFWANGHSVPSELRALADSVRSSYCQTYDVNELRRLAGAERISAGLTLELAASKMVHGHCTVSWRKRPVVLRHCPSCIFDGGGHQVLFDLPLVEACPIHEIRLLSACSDCGSRLAWGSLRAGWLCKCGAFIGNMERAPAVSWQSQLAQWLADMAKREWTGSRSSIPSPYLMLEIALRIRDLVVGGSDVERYLFRHPRAPKRTRKCPERWEITLVLESPERLVIRARRLMRWAFQADPRRLIVDKGSPRIDALCDLLKKSTKGALGPLAKLHQAAELVRRDLRVVPEWKRVHYNPAMPAHRRRAYLTALNAWWQSGRHELVLRARDVELAHGVPTSADAIAWVINSLVEVAICGLPIGRLRAFEAHWLPTQVFSSVDGSIESFVSALSSLSLEELVFLERMLRQDLAWGKVDG